MARDSYLELAGAFRRILRETTRVDDALRIFDAQRVRMLALRDFVVDDVARSIAAAFATTPAALLSAPPVGPDLADARALLAHILVVRGWRAEQLADLLAEDPATVRRMTDSVTGRPSLMTIARLALESASSPSDSSADRVSLAGPPSDALHSAIAESSEAVLSCRDGR
jgi:hypothetical protein